MASKREREIKRLKDEVKLAYSAAQEKENELQSSGLSSEQIKIDVVFVDLVDKVWNLRYTLEIAKGRDPPVKNGTEYRHYCCMREREAHGANLAKDGLRLLSHANGYYEKLRKVRNIVQLIAFMLLLLLTFKRI